VIERDPQTGVATGTLRESATQLIYRHVPAPTSEQLLAGARLAGQLEPGVPRPPVGEAVEEMVVLVYQEHPNTAHVLLAID